MFVWFEDWSRFKYMLDQKGTPHGDSIIKVRASDVDPRSAESFGRSSIAVLEISEAPFTESDVFEYGDRGVYTGLDIERAFEELELVESAKRNARTLFRFASLPETQFVREGMSLHSPDGSWLIDHPILDLHGYDYGVEGKLQPEQIHLDIFVAESLQRLAQLLHIEKFEGSEAVVSFKETLDRGRRELREGKTRRKEG